MLDGLRTAGVFLTRLPILPPARPPSLAEASPYFPVIGIGVGAMLGGLFACLTLFGMPSLPASIIILSVAVLLTGALHEDGLADCADALGPHDRQRRLEVMRDSRLGTFGALALILVMLARLGGLAALWDPWMQLSTLMAVGAASRAAMVPLMTLLPPARSDGLGAAAGRPEPRNALLAVGIGVLACLALLPPATAIAVVVTTGLIAAFWGLMARRCFGGQTGDVLGATQQLAEAAALLAVTAVL